MVNENTGREGVRWPRIRRTRPPSSPPYRYTSFTIVTQLILYTFLIEEHASINDECLTCEQCDL